MKHKSHSVLHSHNELGAKVLESSADSKKKLKAKSKQVSKACLPDKIPLNQIVQGNSIDLLKELPDSSIHLIFADPPYFMRVDGVLKRPEGSNFSGCDDSWDSVFKNNDDYKAFCEKWLKECYRILKPNGSIWVIGSMQCIYSIGGIMQDLGFWFINDVIWHKSNPTPNFHGTRLNNAHETLIWATKSKKSKYTFHYKTAKELNVDIVDFNKGERRQLGSVWKMPVCSGNERLKNNQGKKLHSTQKPQDLLYRIIAISSNINDIVLDPFGGTMTTAAMAKKLGRKYISFEQNPMYIEYGKNRVKSVSFEDNKIARATFDEKPLKVSLSELIQAGFLKINERVYLKKTSIYATLKREGKLAYKGHSYDIHTLTARLKQSKAQRLNGFMYWEVECEGNKRVVLDEIREQYRLQNSQNNI